MQRVYKENEWGKVSKTIPLSILQGSQTWCTMVIVKIFTSCISLFFISGSLTPIILVILVGCQTTVPYCSWQCSDHPLRVFHILFHCYLKHGLPSCLTLYWMVERGMEIGLLKDWRVVNSVQHWCQSVVCGCRHLTWLDEMEFVWRMKWT